MLSEMQVSDDFSIQSSARASLLGELLLSKQERLVLAESCTGGLLSSVITSVPGASQWFEAGLVVYANQSKVGLLGVPVSVIETEGAVSQGVVCALVSGCFEHTSGHVAAAISGIAGPEGGSVDKPVGTVWFGFGQRGGQPFAVHQLFSGDRRSIQEQAVLYALEQLIALVKGK